MDYIRFVSVDGRLVKAANLSIELCLIVRSKTVGFILILRLKNVEEKSISADFA